MEFVSFFGQKVMKDILVVGMLKEGQFPRFMSFMQSEEGIAERKKIADLTKTIGTVAPDQSKVPRAARIDDSHTHACHRERPRMLSPTCAQCG